MKVSTVGLDSLRREEGRQATPYRDAAGFLTVGIGHLLTRDELMSGKLEVGHWVHWDQGLSPEEIDFLFERDLKPVEHAVTAMVRVPLTQGQFDCLCSWTYNVGIRAARHSTLLKLLNDGQYDAVPAQLRRWVYVAGQISEALKARREREIRLWQGGTSTPESGHGARSPTL